MESKKSILDVFNQISNEKQAAKPDLFFRLWKYLNSITPSTSEVDENNISKEVTYVLKRLIQGLGSPRAYIRKNYFATLTLLLSNSNFCSCSLALQYFKEIVDKQLGKYESKGEEGEVLTGKILSYGVALRSKVFLNGTKELQREILSEMLTKSKERSYLPLLAYTFISDFISSIDETFFRTIVWPVLAKEILVDWSLQSFETLYCLLEVQNKFPSVLRKKFIMPVFKTPTILHTETINNVQTMLINITWEPRLKHPLYTSVGRLLVQGCENYGVLTRFWECVEEVMASSPTRLKLLAIFTTFSIIVKYIDIDQIPELLTPLFVENIINSCRPSASKTDKLCLIGRSTLQLIVSRAIEKSENSSSPVVYKILCKLVFDSGQLLIDKFTGVKVVSPCISKLMTKHVKLLAKKCESIVLMKPTEKCGKMSEHRWTFKDRSYATQLLARLISHPESQDMDWKIKHLKLMMKYAIFVPQLEDNVQISSELSAVLKNSFFTALSHQLSHLENHRMVLLSLVYYIDNILTTSEHKLRNTLSDEMLTYWKDSLSNIQKIDLKINKTVKRKTVMYVFQTMFLQMALHIFVDPTTAKDILNELNRCYEKKKIQLKKLKSKEKTTEFLDVSSEPMWIEIAVELLLSLLSRDIYMLRQLIARIFPHLCPFLTAQATFQILQVFDPRSNKYILTDNNAESDEEDSADNEEIEDANEDESEEVIKKPYAEIDSENESDSEVEENEDVEESAIEKTRQAVRDALGVAGSVTDTESIDLDDIDDEEGRKLDIALSEAFRSAKKSQNNKSKKQSPNEKALINFRIRVLDLVDIYLDNNPSLSLVLDTIPTLFTLLAFTIKDSHQKPLENRIRSTMKKIGCLKKCCKVSDVGEELIVESLKTLMDKGVHSTPVFLNLCNEMSECCTFLLRMGMQVTNNEKPEKTSALYRIFATAVDNFFMKRDCLLPISLFENILLKTNWIGNVVLCKQILKLSFDFSVRGFRRNQGLSLLCHFYKNARLLSGLKNICPTEMAELEDEILEHAIEILKQLKTVDDTCVKPSFISELFLLLYTMKNCKFLIGSSKWKELSEVLQSFLNNGPSLANSSKKCLLKLCSTLHVTRASRFFENFYADKGLGESVNCKTVIKKKKSKRKSKKGEEHVNAKRLRNDLANNVEDFNFSEANFSEMTS